MKDCEDIWDELYKEKYGEHSSYFIKNKITYADALQIRLEKNKPLLQNYTQKLYNLNSNDKKNVYFLPLF